MRKCTDEIIEWCYVFWVAFIIIFRICSELNLFKSVKQAKWEKKLYSYLFVCKGSANSQFNIFGEVYFNQEWLLCRFWTFYYTVYVQKTWKQVFLEDVCNFDLNTICSKKSHRKKQNRSILMNLWVKVIFFDMFLDDFIITGKNMSINWKQFLLDKNI